MILISLLGVMSNIHWLIVSLLFLISTYSGVIIKEILSVANCLNPCKGKKIKDISFYVGFIYKLLFEGQVIFHALF